MNFREDINALRAFAVVAVVIFHFNHAWLPGGFAGVDIFFVISGFLMTMIIVKGLERETFSIIGFYKARVRRIIPALAFLCFVLMVLGYFLLSPIDYLNMGKHTTASLTFTSNFVYWKESNYFDASSIEKWLLHTWSLSVEWQFYLLYPVALVVLNKFLNLKQLKLLLVGATILALLLSIYVTFNTSRAAYFLLPTRAWQMLAGGLVFLYPIPMGPLAKRFGLVIGLGLIVLSFFLFSAETPWPGYAALLPIIGTCFVLVSNNGQSILVDNKICHMLGKWSYSIYLWHWPVIVAGFYFSLGENWWMIGLPLSILLGALSFIFIESKTLADYGLKRGGFFFRPLPAASILAVFGLVVFSTNGLLNRLVEPQRTLVASAIAAKEDWSYPDANKVVGPLKVRLIHGQTDKNILILGSSHAEQLYPYVESIDSDYNVYFLTSGGCLATPSMKHPKWNCDNLQNYQLLLDSVKFDKIVTTFFNFDVYLSDEEAIRQEQFTTRTKEYNAFLAQLKAVSNEVYLILGEPRGEEFNPPAVIRYGLQNFMTEEATRKTYAVHNKALSLFTELDGIHIIDPIAHLCHEGICKTSNDAQGFFYRDNNHMRPWYAIKSLTYLEHIFR